MRIEYECGWATRLKRIAPLPDLMRPSDFASTSLEACDDIQVVVVPGCANLFASVFVHQLIHLISGNSTRSALARRLWSRRSWNNATPSATSTEPHDTAKAIANAIGADRDVPAGKGAKEDGCEDDGAGHGFTGNAACCAPSRIGK
jgi:hypothetical protein